MRGILELTAIVLTLLVSVARAEGEGPELFFVIRHLPGPGWNSSLSFADQPGIGRHANYMSQLQDEGLLLLGGPFLDNSGGMVVLRTGSQADAAALAREDPCVKSGLLKVDVKPWRVVLSSMRIQRRRSAQGSIPKGQPFNVQPATPDAPIKLEDEGPVP